MNTPPPIPFTSNEKTPSLRVNIVIPTFNQIRYTRECLQALRQTLGNDPSIQVSIIDNASTDGTRELLTAESLSWPILKWYGFEENKGFNFASNFGANWVSSEFVLFLNNDTVPQPGWLEALIEPFSRKRIGMVGPKLVTPGKNTINHAGYAFNRQRNGFYAIYYDCPADAPYVNRPREFQALLGACLLIRQSVFNEIGGFDKFALEDIALGLKVRKLGLVCLYEPKSVVWHYGSATILGEPGAVHGTDYREFSQHWPASTMIADDEIFYREDGFLLHGFTAQGIKLESHHEQSVTLVEEALQSSTLSSVQVLEKLVEALRLYPHNEKAYENSIRLCAELQLLSEAIHLSKHFLTLRPWDVKHYEMVLNLCLTTGDLTTFQNLAHQALEYPQIPKATKALIASGLRSLKTDSKSSL